jgi:hypothetical protein
VVGLTLTIHIFQYKQALMPSDLEKSQRQQFTRWVKGLIDGFHPSIMADESPDTNNVDLLAIHPKNAYKLCVDIPFTVKVNSKLMVGRPEDSLCPYVDDLAWQLRSS